jgi:hypothetical protein
MRALDGVTGSGLLNDVLDIFFIVEMITTHQVFNSRVIGIGFNVVKQRKSD